MALNIPDKIVNLDPKKLTPYEKNARTHEAYQVRQIMDSINEFGFTNPVLIDGDGGIIAGHGRVLAAVELGLKKVPTITLLHLTPEQKRAYILADNKIALNSGWDEEMLLSELQAIENFDGAYLTGFDEDEVAVLELQALSAGEDAGGKSTNEGGETVNANSSDDSVMFSCPLTEDQHEDINDAVLLAKKRFGVKHTGTALSKICSEWAVIVAEEEDAD